jgi:hypothetical protein
MAFYLQDKRPARAATQHTDYLTNQQKTAKTPAAYF